MMLLGVYPLRGTARPCASIVGHSDPVDRRVQLQRLGARLGSKSGELVLLKTIPLRREEDCLAPFCGEPHLRRDQDAVRVGETRRRQPERIHSICGRQRPRKYSIAPARKRTIRMQKAAGALIPTKAREAGEGVQRVLLWPKR